MRACTNPIITTAEALLDALERRPGLSLSFHRENEGGIQYLTEELARATGSSWVVVEAAEDAVDEVQWANVVHSTDEADEYEPDYAGWLVLDRIPLIALGASS